MRDLHVEIWSDIACPWCYIGKRRFAAALADFEHRDHVRVTWRSFELQPDAEPSTAHPGLTEAQMLSERKGMPVDQVRQMFDQVTAVAASVGLAYDFDTVVPANTFDAHRLVHVAASLGGDAAAAEVVERLMSAHFEHGRVVDDLDVLVEIAVEAGLDGDAVRTALATDAGAGAVRADEAEAAALGIQGVPFFVADRRLGLSGAQPVEVFAQLLSQAWADANPPLAIPTIAGAADAEACGPDGC
ncbi:DsbA family oxidoreductase [Cellulomonas sp. PS-H5]|uniref:DsbA family oxidoreductase n=1 Tax=Cellulomonas sp. PS-H5 TaxID=2820400 RepID=UPI001C4F764D|nr:DsbA family oxidoreductase [Cellulomonas sp. PS-H5]MBW0255758.1 DsbA family oxidoreductase [Cellulomonas sp. PS-H5]